MKADESSTEIFITSDSDKVYPSMIFQQCTLLVCHARLANAHLEPLSFV